MTTLTVNIDKDKDLNVLTEILSRFGLSYTLNEIEDYPFTKEELVSFQKTKQDFLEGKTTARNWEDIEKDLNSAYN